MDKQLNVWSVQDHPNTSPKVSSKVSSKKEKTFWNI